MKNFRYYLTLGVSLLIVSSITYLLQIYFFHRPDDTLFYLFQDLAFVPVQALLVMFILDRLLKRKEKEAQLKKLNMIIGVFFNEMGSEFMQLLFDMTTNSTNLSEELLISDKWDDTTFSAKIKQARLFEYQIDVDQDRLMALKAFLVNKQDQMNRLLENPNLLEHETFTDLLWAVLHISDELFHRASLQNLPVSDMAHLRGDILRAYKLILIEWLAYMKHLKQNYPYMFSIAIRTNPLNPDKSVIIS
jgi:hypothetical protein